MNTLVITANDRTVTIEIPDGADIDAVNATLRDAGVLDVVRVLGPTEAEAVRIQRIERQTAHRASLLAWARALEPARLANLLELQGQSSVININDLPYEALLNMYEDDAPDSC